MRHLDTVILKGSSEPIRIFTCDVDPKVLKLSEMREISDRSNQKKELYIKRVHDKKKRDDYREKAFLN